MTSSLAGKNRRAAGAAWATTPSLPYANGDISNTRVALGPTITSAFAINADNGHKLWSDKA
jgi:hypothetical protein